MMAVSMETQRGPGAGRRPRAQEDRAALDGFARELGETFGERVAARPAATPEGSSAAVSVSLDGEEFATFGVIDATYYWTFDGGESCHYAKDKAVMKRFLTFELRAAARRNP